MKGILMSLPPEGRRDNKSQFTVCFKPFTHKRNSKGPKGKSLWYSTVNFSYNICFWHFLKNFCLTDKIGTKLLIDSKILESPFFLGEFHSLWRQKLFVNRCEPFHLIDQNPNLSICWSSICWMVFAKTTLISTEIVIFRWIINSLVVYYFLHTRHTKWSFPFFVCSDNLRDNW